MIVDTGFLVLAVPAVIIAGISKGGFGSGASFVATPILALVLSPEQAVGIMLPLLMLIDLATLRPYWGRWSRPDASRLILGGIPGVALGAAFWSFANPDLLRFLIGTIALGFVAFQLALRRGHFRPRQAPAGPAFGAIAGCVAGFTSFISHAGGPPAAVYLLSRGLTKTGYQATTVLVFWVINLAKAVPYGFLGMFGAESLATGLWLAPAALLGAWIGVVAHRAIPERLYFAVTYALLTLSGSKLIYDALA